ncbi:MAG: hypothetical protein CMK09_08510 [Ponticaulis sp.]|nr:hypothetical protein [Ponticaulis sp.]|tara:strand:- start:11968 stop:14448 length:2481 start_codon:yes stop_codon:yes gene_type:complete
MIKDERRFERLKSDEITRRHRPRLDEYEPVDNHWDHAVELWDVIRPAWWPILITLVLCFLVVGNEQIKDVLAAMPLEHSNLDARAQGAAGLSGRYWTTLAACAVYAFIAWAFARGLLSIRYPYTPCPFDPPDWHVVVRMAVARGLGLALPISCALSYLSMQMAQEAIFYSILALILLLIYWISRRYIHDWIQEQHERDEAEEMARETGTPLSPANEAAAAKAEALSDIDEALEEAEETLDEASRTHDTERQRDLLNRVALLAEQAGNAVKAAGNEFREADLFDQSMPDRFSQKVRYLLYGILVFHAIAAIGFLIFPVRLPQMIGAAAILFLAIAGLLAFGTFVFCYYTRFWKLPPAILLFTVWLAFASQFNDNHTIARLSADETPEVRAPRIEPYIVDWLEARQDALPKTMDDPAFPVLIIAAEGGGARAAYWTGSVLADLDAVTPSSGFKTRDHIFLVSGVSGGALGAATYGASIVEEQESGQSASMTVDAFLTQDFLSPVTAGALYHDLFTDFVPFPLHALDRAKWLEGSWQDGWKRETGSDLFSEDFRGLWNAEEGRQPLGALGAVPLLTFNTTSVRSGGTWHVSPVRYADSSGCESRDFVDLVEADGRGMSLATAAHLSARFTGVSPAGRIDLKGYDDCPAKGFDRFVDGAYFENSGADIAVRTYRRLNEIITAYCGQIVDGEQKCVADLIQIVPIAIVAEQPKTSNPPTISHETNSVLVTVVNTRMARGVDSLERLDDISHNRLRRIELAVGWNRSEEDLHCEPYPARLTAFDAEEGEPNDYRSVPLGWTLSQDAVEHMCRQRISNPVLDEVKALLTGKGF